MATPPSFTRLVSLDDTYLDHVRSAITGLCLQSYWTRVLLAFVAGSCEARSRINWNMLKHSTNARSSCSRHDVTTSRTSTTVVKLHLCDRRVHTATCRSINDPSNRSSSSSNNNNNNNNNNGVQAEWGVPITEQPLAPLGEELLCRLPDHMRADTHVRILKVVCGR